MNITYNDCILEIDYTYTPGEKETSDCPGCESEIEFKIIGARPCRSSKSKELNIVTDEIALTKESLYYEANELTIEECREIEALIYGKLEYESDQIILEKLLERDE